MILGGTDLMVAIRDGRARPERVVDLGRIPQLSEMETVDGALRIGAAVKVTDVINNSLVKEKYPALVDAGRLLGGWQIQNMATLAGNICNASPAAEMAGPLLVLDAQVEVHGPGGRSSIPLDRFWKGPGRTVLAPAEIVTALIIPAEVDGRASAYQRVHIRHSVDIALACCAARLEFDGKRVRLARIALGALAPTPIRVPEAESCLQGVALSEAVLDRAEQIAMAAARPITDVRASAEYRKAMTGVLVRRVIQLAAQRR
jgi:carbon-monoxide dehydrogenase medium subunit